MNWTFQTYSTSDFLGRPLVMKFCGTRKTLRSFHRHQLRHRHQDRSHQLSDHNDQWLDLVPQMILMAVAMMLKAMARTRAKDKVMAIAMARTRRRHKTRTMAEIRRRHK